MKLKVGRTLAIALISISLSVAISPGSVLANPMDYRSMFQPLPTSNIDISDPVIAARVKLGELLFKDARFSKSGTISCNSCHNLENYGVDGEATSPGHDGSRGDRNSPTVLNAALHFSQFWDGRAKDVEEQALGPVLNPIEMGMANADAVQELITSDPTYVNLFKQAFPDNTTPITFENFGKAIGTFERTLITPAPFDAYLNGDDSALTEIQKKGLARFVEIGCTACHSGATIGGLMFQKLGLVKPYPTEDIGRSKVTGNEAEKFFFKVPSLRNVARTAPYFHDGSVKTLDQAISIMAEYQLGRTLDAEARAEIRAFLESLTGKI